MAVEALKLAVINEALVMTGDQPLDGLDSTDDDDPTTGAVLSRLYDTIVNAGITHRRWTWCRDVERLTKLSGVTIPGWAYAYQLPADCATLWSVHDADRVPLRFDRFSDLIATDADDPVHAEFVRRLAETEWPPLFRLGVVQWLAAIVTRAGIENLRLADVNTTEAMHWFAELARVEAQGRSPSRIDMGYLARARRAGWRSRW